MQRSRLMNYALQRQRQLQQVRRSNSNSTQIIRRQLPSSSSPLPCDVFINHRGVDTKKTIASLLYDHLVRLRLRPFLDNKTMKPGDKLFDKIDSAIMRCKIGVAVFSPRYCDSYFCLHELALMVESRKKVIPIFCDVKPSELHVPDDNGIVPPEQIQRFNTALQEAKYTVGLDFDSHKGNWADVVKNAADIVVESLIEAEEEEEEEGERFSGGRVLLKPASLATS